MNMLVTGSAGPMPGWRATRSIDDLCAGTWRRQADNPLGNPS